jgi:hypothetical protein
MEKEYNTQETPHGLIIWYEENGFRFSFTEDPANSDYQEYLESLNEAKTK